MPDDDPAPYLTPALVAWRRWTDAPLLVLALGSLPLLVLEVARDRLASADRTFLTIVNYTILVAFAVDYVVELALATRRSVYVRKEWTSLLVVVAQAVTVAAPAFAPAGALRVLRTGRAWRIVAVIARLVAIGGAATRDGRRILRRHAAGFALAVAGFTWVSSAVDFTLAEDVGPKGRLHSFFDALWWATTTITTVGYGDVYPTTGVGRLIGAFTMLVGISTFAVVTAKIAEFLVRGPADDADADAAVDDAVGQRG